NRTQTSAAHIVERRGNARSIETFERDEPDNVAIRHYRLLRRKCRPYLPRLHIYLGDTKDAHTHQSRRCNTISPWAPHPPVAEWLFGCVPRPPPSPIDSAFCGPQVSECRFCF